MTEIQDSILHNIKYCVPTTHNTPHIFQNTDFSRIQKCVCSTNCTKHLSFAEEPLSPPSKTEAPDLTHPLIQELNILDKELDISPQIHTIQKVQILKGQNDIGANTSVTNNKASLLLYQDITPLTIGGVHKDDPAITCTGKGYIMWQAQNGNNLLVPAYYCEHADGTMILPHSIQELYKTKFSGFHLFCDCGANI